MAQVTSLPSPGHEERSWLWYRGRTIFSLQDGSRRFARMWILVFPRKNRRWCNGVSYDRMSTLSPRSHHDENSRKRREPGGNPPCLWMGTGLHWCREFSSFFLLSINSSRSYRGNSSRERVFPAPIKGKQRSTQVGNDVHLGWRKNPTIGTVESLRNVKGGSLYQGGRVRLKSVVGALVRPQSTKQTFVPWYNF